MKRRYNQDYLKSVIFGFEDGLVSTTGVIAGISTAIANREFLLLAGLVTVVVEAFSMGAGQFISERAVHQMDKKHSDSIVIGGMLMFFSYIFGGLVPLLPILLFSQFSIVTTLIFAFTALFVLGFVKGKAVSVDPIKSAGEIMIIGGVAAVAGVAVGYLFKPSG